MRLFPRHKDPDAWATDLPWLLWGRRVKPQAIVAVIALYGVAIGPLYGGTRSEVFDFHSVPGEAMAVVAAVLIVVLVSAWWARSSRLLAVGLFGAMFVFGCRAFLALLESGPEHPATWISVALTTGMAWAWLIEKAAVR